MPQYFPTVRQRLVVLTTSPADNWSHEETIFSPTDSAEFEVAEFPSPVESFEAKGGRLTAQYSFVGYSSLKDALTDGR